MALRIGDELIWSNSGDVLEVKIRDNQYKTTFKAECNLHDKKKLNQLLRDLRDKGVSFNIPWFE